MVGTLAVVAAAVLTVVSFGRRRRQERREVKNMLSTSEGDRVWWEDRR